MLPNGPAIQFEHEASLAWSIVMPVHRKRDGLKRCVESVLPQLRDGMELVIADHCGMLPADWRWHDISNVRMGGVLLEKVEPTGSMAGDWNRALSLCRGRWIHLLHDDDYVLPRFYESFDFESRERYEAGASGYRNVDQAGKETWRQLVYPCPLWPSVVAANPFQPCAVVVSREAYERLGGYVADPALKHCPDWELCCRLAWAGCDWHFVEECLAVHTEGSAECESAAPFTEQIRSYAALMKYLHQHGCQADACRAGLESMKTLMLRRTVEAAADRQEESKVSELFQTAVGLEWQQRKYKEKP